MITEAKESIDAKCRAALMFAIDEDYDHTVLEKIIDFKAKVLNQLDLATLILTQPDRAQNNLTTTLIPAEPLKSRLEMTKKGNLDKSVKTATTAFKNNLAKRKLDNMTLPSINDVLKNMSLQSTRRV